MFSCIMKNGLEITFWSLDISEKISWKIYIFSYLFFLNSDIFILKNIYFWCLENIENKYIFYSILTFLHDLKYIIIV